MANESRNTGSDDQNQDQNRRLKGGLYENQDLSTGPQAQSEGLYGKDLNEVKNPMAAQDNVYAETTDDLGYTNQSGQAQQEQQEAWEKEINRETTPYQQHAGAAVYGEAPGETGHECTPYQDMQPVTQPEQQRQANTAEAQDRLCEQQAGVVPGQQRGPIDCKNIEHVSGMTGYYGGTTEQGQAEQEEQEEQQGQKVNVEQSHQTNTAQYTGKPGAKAPSPGQEEGTAWGQDMELGNEDVPARNPYGY